MRTDDGVRLHVEVDGPEDAALTVVFAHGIADTLHTWRGQRAALADRRIRLVCYDHRAFGRSESGTGPPSVDRLADDLRQLIAATACGGPVVLVGHSMGALTVQALSAFAPELFGTQVVATVLLAHPLHGELLTLRLPPRIARQLRLRAVPALTALARRGVRTRGVSGYFARRAFSAGTPRAVSHDVVARVTANPPRVLAAYLNAVLACDHRSTVAALGRSRTVVVLGVHDRLVPPAATRAAAEAIPGTELYEIEGAGHMVHLERPDQVNRILGEVIATALVCLRGERSL